MKRVEEPLKCGELTLVLRKVSWSVVCSEASKVGWCCIDRPRQSFDNGVMGVNHPAAGCGVANGAMVLLQKVHGLGFTAAGELSPPAPG